MKPQTSERKRAANRRNALASTGPVTLEGKRRARLNALVHGRYARLPLECTTALDEDPSEYEALLADLIEAHRPSNSSERMLVEDIAALRRQRRRADRALAGKQAHALQALEFERRRLALEMRRSDPPVPFITMKIGLRSMPDSPGKFRMLLNYLEMLLVSAQAREFPAAGRDALDTVYGVAPSASAKEILMLWDGLVKSPPSPSGDCTRAEIFCAKMRGEIALVEEEFELYKAENVEVSQVRRDAALAPEGRDWPLLIRQLNVIDRNLDRKLRLLLEMQRARARSGFGAGRTPKMRGSKQSITRSKKASK